MKRGWKIALISVGSLIGLLAVAVAMVLWMVFTPSRLTAIVNRLAERYVECETHFDDVGLTLFKTFPNAGVVVRGVDIINPVDGAPTDTVAHVDELAVGIDVRRYLKAKDIVVSGVSIDGARACIYTSASGESNLDIFPRSEQAEDTAESHFDLADLPNIELGKLAVRRLDAIYLDARSAAVATVGGMQLDGTLCVTAGKADGDIKMKAERLRAQLSDSTGCESLFADLSGTALTLAAKGDMDRVGGRLTLECKDGDVRVGGQAMVNEKLAASDQKLVRLATDVEADLRSMEVKLNRGEIALDSYALQCQGEVALPAEERALTVDVDLHTVEPWQVGRLIELLPEQYATFADGMTIDAALDLRATAKGTLTDSTMPIVEAQATLADGRFYSPRLLPYDVREIGGDLTASIDLGRGGKSRATIERLSATTRGTTINLKAAADDLMGDMYVVATIAGTMPIEDAMPMVPDSIGLKASGRARLNGDVAFRLSDVQQMNLERIAATVAVSTTGLDVDMPSLRASAPTLDVRLQMPAKQYKGSMADVYVAGQSINVDMPGCSGVIGQPSIAAGVNNITKQQPSAKVDIAIGETEANIDSMMVSFDELTVKGSMQMDSTQSNPLHRFNPVAEVGINSAVLYMPELPDAMRLSQFLLKYDSKVCELGTAELKLGHSDFQLYGEVDNLDGWLDHKQMLQADLNLTSGYADVDQLMAMFSGMGTDDDTLQKMREEDNVPKEAAPFIVPRDVDVTLHTHIKRSIAFGNDLSDVAGAVTIKDGVAILDQIGFVSKAATMQLTALYKSPRPNNLFVALDFHLLEIEIKELLEMIPTVDTLVPMLAAFDGNANFHLAAETYLDAFYQPKMSTLLGSAAISGRDLTLMDNNTISQVAKLMQLKSWKEKDDKIKIDSIDVELTCLRKEIEVYPFLLNMGKYSFCLSGKHTLDNQCGYHIELLKNPLLARVGVDVRGNLSSPKISLGEVRYADLYRPERQGVVEKRTLELKRMIKQALEANVR